MFISFRTVLCIYLYLPRHSHDSSSLCRTSSLRWISFLEDTQSGCFLQLSRKNFTHCEQLRNEISRIQAELIEIELLIAKGGSNSDVPLTLQFPDRNYTTYYNLGTVFFLQRPEQKFAD